VEYIPVLSQAIEADLAQLNAQFSPNADEPYVQAEARWWGLVLILSPQACKDLANGYTGIAAVVAAASGVLALIPGAQPLAPAVGVLSAIIGGAAVVISTVDRGRGIYLSSPWALIWSGTWVPTPR
jgi:hypothetical protein